MTSPHHPVEYRHSCPALIRLHRDVALTKLDVVIVFPWVATGFVQVGPTGEGETMEMEFLLESWIIGLADCLEKVECTPPPYTHTQELPRLSINYRIYVPGKMKASRISDRRLSESFRNQGIRSKGGITHDVWPLYRWRHAIATAQFLTRNTQLGVEKKQSSGEKNGIKICKHMDDGWTQFK